MGKCEDLSGHKFGRLIPIKRVENKGNYAMWLCQCDCGNTMVTRATSLKNGHTQSCGCLHKERLRCANQKHGLYQHRIYSIYTHMIGRCYNKSEAGYESYGGRGVSVCDEWKNDFSEFAKWAFAHGYGDELTLDRIDVNGNYCPENCRWATYKEQANNTRKNHIIQYHGETFTMREFCDKYHFSYSLLNSRLFRGWDLEKAIETPRMENYCRQ